MEEEDEGAVLAAFLAAKRADRPPVECYRAGVDAWCRLHPEHAPPYAAQQAMRILLRDIFAAQAQMIAAAADHAGSSLG